jgi:hypothetical protein
MKRYGLTEAALNAMKRTQGYRCAICRKLLGKGKQVHVDHCHKTKRIRGILCAGCNSAIGKLGDTAAGLRRAIAYLDAFETQDSRYNLQGER